MCQSAEVAQELCDRLKTCSGEEYARAFTALEGMGFVCINWKPFPVQAGNLDLLFSGTKESPADWRNIPVFARSKPNNGGLYYLVSDDLKRWRVWCPCTEVGAPVCVRWNTLGLPDGVDLDENGAILKGEEVMKASRAEVIHAIAGERDYQDRKWNPDTTASGGEHGAGDFMLFMQHHLELARAAFSTLSEPEASLMALHQIRKVTALGVSCMEHNGAPTREQEQERSKP